MSLRRWLPHLLALALCLALALERLWSAALDPGQVIVCQWTHPDCLGNHWLLVWVAEQLRSGGSLLHNDAYYAPIGDAPWLAGNGSEGFLYLPFYLIWGWPKGASLLLIATLVGNGLAGYTLGRAAGAGPWAALVSAAALGSSVYAVQEMGAGRFSQADLIFLTLGFAGCVALLRGGRRWALSGVALAIAAILYWYHGLFLVLALGALVLARGVARAPVPAGSLARAGLLAVLLAGPVLAVYLHNWQLIPGTIEEPFPHPEAIGDALRPSLPFAVRDGRMVAQAMSAPVLALALYALVRLVHKRSDDRATDLGLLAVVVLFYWLALGPGGGLYEAVYGLAAPLRRFWWPHRHLAVVQLAAAALAARGAQALVGRFGAPVAVILALSVSPALRVAGDPTRVFQSPAKLPPAFYVELAAQPGELLLQLPFSPRAASTQTPLIYQLFHRKRTINGHAPWVDRVRPPAWDQLVAQNSFLAGLAAYEAGWPEERILRFDPKDLQTLIDQGFGLIVVDSEHFAFPLRPLADGYRDLLEQLFGPPVHRHKRAWAWSTAGWSGAAELTPKRWAWPAGLHPGNGTQPLSAMRPASPTFDPEAGEGD